MKKQEKIFLGISFILFGIFLGLRAFGLEFEGWWAFFIILFCVVRLITGEKTVNNMISNIAGIIFGLILFFACINVIPWKIIIPSALVLIGLNLILCTLFRKAVKVVSSQNEEDEQSNESEPNQDETNLEFDREEKEGTAVLTSVSKNLKGKKFSGAELNGVFGKLTYNLKKAVISENCNIEVCSIFGFVRLLVPENVDVQITSTSVFGFVSDKKSGSDPQKGVTVYIDVTSKFGGVVIE